MSLRSVLGQNVAVNLLLEELRSQTVKHAYLFHGVKGVGKKYTAVQFARALQCLAPIDTDACDHCEACHRIMDGTHPDVVIVDFAFQAELLREKVLEQRSIGIETVREIQRLAALTGYHAVRKVFIIDAAETMQEACANSLLKTLEEPPGACIFILVAAGMGWLPRTIISRCELVPFRPLDIDTLRICAGSGVNDDLLSKAHGSLERLEALRQLGADRMPEALLRTPLPERYAILDALVRGGQRDIAKQLIFCLIEHTLHRFAQRENDQAIGIAQELLDHINTLRMNIDIRVLMEFLLTRLELSWNKN